VTTALEILLAGVVLSVAAWTIAARDTFAAIAGFVAYGLLLSLVWIRLGAPDVALTEAAIGSGLTGAMLLSTSARLRTTEGAGGLAAAVLFLPLPPPTLAPMAAENAGATGLGNPVTNVLMAFRAMDTMLEKVVLLLALVGVWSLAPDRAWGGRPGPRHHADPDGVLAFLARLLPPVGIVMGADEPGGAFQGGTILAAMWLLVMMAGLADAPPAGRRALRLVLAGGTLVFLAVGLGGLAWGDAFLAYPVAYAKPLILAIEFAMLLTVAATLALLVAGPPETRPT
jgi:multisubunit Na+/H+ antiporter MnhB subunit